MFLARSGDHRGLAAAMVTGLLAVFGLTSIATAGAVLPATLLPAQSAVAAPVRSVPELSPATRPQPSTPPLKVGPVLPASLPMSLAIPAIGVRSSLLRLGLTSAGEMETPRPGRQYNQAGWYRHSPTPGTLGPAVIAGHVDSAKEGPSVFFRLGELRPNDTVSVTRADGSVAIFAVDSVHRYSKSQFPTQLVYGNTNHAALRLITCGGRFDRGSGNYLDNIVVFATLVRAEGVA